MSINPLHELHETFDARFSDAAGFEVVQHYGDTLAEVQAFRETVGLIDLSARGRICVLGTDRQRFLHGQVTNNVKDLKPGRGCYAALVTAKGKIEADLNIYALEEEVLLDFEPGLTESIMARLERYVIADDVQLIDVAPHYGLLSMQGPVAGEVIPKIGLDLALPAEPLSLSQLDHPTLGKIYCMNIPRLLSPGYDLFVPLQSMAIVADHLLSAVRELKGTLCGWDAFDQRRIECGLPRFGVDMDSSNLAPETGIEERAISYNKGCYIGQEVIARIRTYGQVNKSLRGLRLDPEFKELPARGDKLFADDKEVGYITSALHSPTFSRPLALGYVRREYYQLGTDLILKTSTGPTKARVVSLPFREEELG